MNTINKKKTWSAPKLLEVEVGNTKTGIPWAKGVESTHQSSFTYSS
ncbi:MAG: hypothetical protein ACO3EE_03665 [Flavobacteriales bacterium]